MEDNYNIVLVLPYVSMNRPQVYMCSLKPDPPTPATSLPTLYRVVPVHRLWVTCFMHRTCIWTSILHMVTSCEELTHWKRLWCWEGLGAGGKGDDRGRDGWMASPTRWTWVRVNSGRWWWTGRPGMLQFMGSQRVGHDWATELNIHISMLFSEITPPSNWYHFLTTLVYFLSLCYILVFLTVFQTFPLLLLYLLWRSLLSDLFCLFFPNFYNLHISFFKLRFLVLADVCCASECLYSVPQCMLLLLAFQH